MALIACGINHNTAPLAIREQVALSPENIPHILCDILHQGAANEAMILSTCNRTEIYTHTLQPSRFADWIFRHPKMGSIANSNHWYWHQDQAAVNHIMRVATGLNSMILGESQISNQLKQAFNLAKRIGTIGSELQRLVQNVFSVTKKVRTHTGIGANSVSIAYAGVNLAKQIFSDLSRSHVLLIGSGETIELTSLYLSKQGIKEMTIANRSLDKAQKLAHQFSAQAVEMEKIPLYLQHADIVISATSSPNTILEKEVVQQALKKGKRRPLLMLDLAVPRDISPQVADLEDVYLYVIDDLREIVSENLKSRQKAAKQAEEMIAIQAQYYMQQQQSLNAVETICAYREKLEVLRDAELAKALNLLKRGEAPEEILATMSKALINKILHTPVTQIRQASLNGETDFLLCAKKLFNI